MRRKVYILESFSFKGAQIPNRELPETMGSHDQHVPLSLGKRLLAEDQDSVIQLSLRNSPRLSKLTLVRKTREGQRPGLPLSGP